MNSKSLKENLLKASIVFRAFYRLTTHCRGRPDYPEPIDWTLIENWLNGTILTTPMKRDAIHMLSEGDIEDEAVLSCG